MRFIRSNSTRFKAGVIKVNMQQVTRTIEHRATPASRDINIRKEQRGKEERKKKNKKAKGERIKGEIDEKLIERETFTSSEEIPIGA